MSTPVSPRVLADTSILIGVETDQIDRQAVESSISVSVVTVAELRLGVLASTSLAARARRLATLRLAESLEPLPIDDAVADSWAILVAALHAAGRTPPPNETWIAATAIAREMPLVTQNEGYEDMPGLHVVRI